MCDRTFVIGDEVEFFSGRWKDRRVVGTIVKTRDKKQHTKAMKDRGLEPLYIPVAEVVETSDILGESAIWTVATKDLKLNRILKFLDYAKAVDIKKEIKIFNKEARKTKAGDTARQLRDMGLCSMNVGDEFQVNYRGSGWKTVSFVQYTASGRTKFVCHFSGKARSCAPSAIRPLDTKD